MDDNTVKQTDEIEVLTSIYGSDWKVEDDFNREYSIKLTHSSNSDMTVTLCFTVPENYPTSAPPMCELSAPALKKYQKDLIYDEINKIYLENIGETVLYQWIEKIREILENIDIDADLIEPVSYSPLNDIASLRIGLERTFDIVHGEIIEDRKSAFQAHVAKINDPKDVELVLRQLKLDRKIDGATHNIYAWRCGKSYDCDDDGEKAAGRRLLSLLELTNVNDVLVVVSRWYGGVLLGKTRFRHINNAARQAMVQARIIDH